MMYPNILQAQRHLGTHDDGSQLLTGRLPDGVWVAELRSPDGSPLFDPIAGERELRGVGRTLEEALRALDHVCDTRGEVVS